MSYYVPDYKLEDEQEATVRFCDECNGDLYEGDAVYNLDSDVICEECLASYFRDFLTTVDKEMRK